jgi:hypothetical protein
MKNLDQIDPLPKFESVGTYTRPDGAQIWSKRQNEEWAKARQKESGEDWRPAPDAIYPTTQVNGSGKFQTKDYKPPEPPETDIPIPCVSDILFSTDLSKMVFQWAVMGDQVFKIDEEGQWIPVDIPGTA